MNDRFAALEWTPEGRRARGRPKTSRRRTVEREGKAGWKSWNLAKGASSYVVSSRVKADIRGA